MDFLSNITVAALQADTCNMTDTDLGNFYGGFFNEWYGHDYTEDFQTCFKPSADLKTATCDYINALVKGDKDAIVAGVIGTYNQAAHYDTYFGSCKNAEDDMGECKGWYDQWQKKGADDIQTECSTYIDYGFQMGKIQERAKAVADAITAKDFKTAGDGAAWISFIGLPHVYPGASDAHTIASLISDLLQ